MKQFINEAAKCIERNLGVQVLVAGPVVQVKVLEHRGDAVEASKVPIDLGTLMMLDDVQADAMMARAVKTARRHRESEHGSSIIDATVAGESARFS